MEEKDIKQYSPMIQQYLLMKQDYEDTLLLYRVGDFYELFFEDAQIVSKELDLVLTGKSAGVEERIPMCGVPFHAVQGYIQKLAQRGYKIAIADQLSDPATSVGLVERDVIRVITPGTLIDEMSDDKQNVFLASIEDSGIGYSIAFVEVSSGDNYVIDVYHQSQELVETLLKNHVKEIVVAHGFSKEVIKLIQLAGIVISYCDVTEIDKRYEPLLKNLTKQYQLDAYGRMLAYLENTQKHLLSHLQICTIETKTQYLAMDYASQLNLELTTAINRDTNSKTLWSFMDVCKSSMGSRRLKKWIEKPLVDQSKILMRLDRVQYLLDHIVEKDQIRDCLFEIYDLQRILTRIAMNHGTPVDCYRLQKTLCQVPRIFERLEDPIFEEYTKVPTLSELSEKLAKAIVENPVAVTFDGGYIKDGYDTKLDEYRQIQANAKTFIGEYEAQEKNRTGIKTLKIGYNRVFGYYIEISKGALSQVQDDWGYVRKQTLTNSERFVSDALKEKEELILHAQSRAIELEKQILDQLLEEIQQQLPQLQTIAYVLSEIDCLCAFAKLSETYGYVRPTFTNDTLKIVQGKHPILDAMMKNPRFVANDIEMDEKRMILLITGPNMGGKSTYMRQTAMIVIMAQMGCFVPAKSCALPIFDQIFTRIGASDDILKGQSTFMVEMSQANLALQYATEHSLILFDEIGRGTSTYDGMALAQAMIEYIATCVKAKTLFSTHYHELTGVCQQIDTVKNVSVMVKEDENQITFLYKIKEGSADRSYGIHVAKLAGIPNSVLDRSMQIQKELESTKKVVQQNFQLVEMVKEDPVLENLKQQLLMVNLDDVSPRNALDILYELKGMIKDKHENG